MPSSLATRVVALPVAEHAGAAKKALQPVLVYELQHNSFSVKFQTGCVSL